jgi:hypothetical protein
MQRGQFKSSASDSAYPGDFVTAAKAGIPNDIVLICARRGVATAEQHNGLEWFSSRDIAKMKLIHAMVLQVRVQNALLACYRAAKNRESLEPPVVKMPFLGSELYACARELIASASP